MYFIYLLLTRWYTRFYLYFLRFRNSKRDVIKLVIFPTKQSFWVNFFSSLGIPISIFFFFFVFLASAFTFFMYLYFSQETVQSSGGKLNSRHIEEFDIDQCWDERVLRKLVSYSEPFNSVVRAHFIRCW